MGTPSSYVIFEKTGRWAAALRIALERRQSPLHRSRISETRSLGELDLAINGHDAALALIEVRPESVADVLSFLAKSSQRPVRVVAMLEFGGDQNPGCRLVADALLEAGAVAVIESSRQLGMVLEIAERPPTNDWNKHAGTIADRAWAALPWQDGQ